MIIARIAVLCFLIGAGGWLLAAAEPSTISFVAQSRPEKEGKRAIVEADTQWEAQETALIIIDLWDTHTCKSAAKRTAELAPTVNELAVRVRKAGGLVIHAPSDTMAFYEGSAARKLAQGAAKIEPPTPHKGWRYLDAAKEGKLPIDDSDGGCDCGVKCEQAKNGKWPWTRQHAAVEIIEGDAVSDKGPEIFNLLAGRKIKNIIICGVHLNMCVLGRPFGIRQLTEWKFNIILVRDLTDTMYNPKLPPMVSHDKGTQLMIEHVEKFWCPTATSAALLKSK